MQSERFEMRVPEGFLERVDAARGLESRASFVKRAVVEKLNGGLAVTIDAGVVEAARSASLAPLGFTAEEDAAHAESVRRAAAREFVGGGCPDCGGQWERRVGEQGRFCVECGARESR